MTYCDATRLSFNGSIKHNVIGVWHNIGLLLVRVNFLVHQEIQELAVEISFNSEYIVFKLLHFINYY